MEGEKQHNSPGLVFVACMFIGAGIGLLFGRPDVGGCIGMGIGFLMMGIIHTKKVKPSPITISLPKNFGHLVLSIIGIVITVCGLCLLFNPDILYPYVVGIGVVVLGVIILLSGLTGWQEKK
jgi:hypothetical protein